MWHAAGPHTPIKVERDQNFRHLPFDKMFSRRNTMQIMVKAKDELGGRLTDNGGIRKAFFNRLPDIDISDQLPDITSPTLALTGDSDPMVPPEQSLIIAERVQKGKKVLKNPVLIYDYNRLNYKEADYG